jgi:hypothetical protein
MPHTLRQTHAPRTARRLACALALRGLAAGAIVLLPAAAAAQEAGTFAPPANPPADSDGSTARELWRANFQATYLWQKHPSFSAPYDGPHSLTHRAESGYTLSATLFLGLQPFRGTEIFFNPETIQSEEFSELHGLGGFSNSENQKSGGPMPAIYAARLFVRQTVNLGGARQTVPDGPNQFAAPVARRRLVLTLGRVSLIDIFDGNAYAHDGRTQFMNWMFMAHGASDYAADARGYTWGLSVELYLDAWAFRFGRFAQPKESNGLAMNFRLWQSYGDNLEIEHAHTLFGRPGRLRLLGIHNRARMAAFEDSIQAADEQGVKPSLGDVRRMHSKLAIGLGIEQTLRDDLGVFARLSWNDGRTETYAFTEVDQSFTAGAVARGTAWHRPGDAFGLGIAVEGISDAHRSYLARGGLGPFIGDGQLPHYARERLIEAYYSLEPARGFWTTAGYQWIGNPAYNADRGPVSIFSIRVHAEY